MYLHMEMLSPNPTSGEFGGSSPPPSRAPWMYHLRVKHQSHLAPPLDRAAFGQSCTSPCSSDVPDTVGAWEFGRARRCRLLCLCCCLELCACRLELGRLVFGRGWELGHAHRTGPSSVPTCSLVASQSAGRKLGQGEMDHCFAPRRSPLCV